jgi:quinol-cytochrome oxidoreductase complex cytochrome b subunit
MMQLFKSIGAWIDERVQLGSTIVEVTQHPVPRSSASWWYVFGSATLVVFILQVVTGICLATVYTPAADRAWNSLIYLDYQQPLGWYLRALHGWGSNFMIALMFVHMVQVFLFGAYKYPRELTWVAGCVLLLSPAKFFVSIKTHTGVWGSAPRLPAAFQLLVSKLCVCSSAALSSPVKRYRDSSRCMCL